MALSGVHSPSGGEQDPLALNGGEMAVFWIMVMRCLGGVTPLVGMTAVLV